LIKIDLFIKNKQLMATKSKAKKCATKGARKSIGGKVFSLAHRSSSKASATRKAKKHREAGKSKMARVVKDGCGYAVYTRG
jgi:hypothetical protein